MTPEQFLRRVVVGLAILAIAGHGETARAQLYRQEVVVGLTPTCSEGFRMCWTEARDGLTRPEIQERLGIASVAESPDLYNCTVTVTLKDGVFPDPDEWREQCQRSIGGALPFRGIEVTVNGPMRREGDRLVVGVVGAPGPITLAPLRDKLQYNFGKDAKHRDGAEPRKGSPRQPEPDEQAAYDRLAAEFGASGRENLEVQITGPLVKTPEGLVIEAREYVNLADAIPTDGEPEAAPPRPPSKSTE